MLLVVTEIAVAAPEKILVKSVTIQKLELFDQFNAIGQCKNAQSRSYYLNSPGRVDQLSACQGDEVKTGEVIIAINQEIAIAAKAKAHAAFKVAELSHLRVKSLFDQKISSSEALEQSKLNLATAKQSLAEAVKVYDDLIITAPFDGVIGVVKARLGDQLQAGYYLFSIIAKGPKNIFLELPESLHNLVASGTKAIITDTNGHYSRGNVLAVSPYLSDGGMISISIAVDDHNLFMHGSYVNVGLIINQHLGLVVPEQAILKNDQGNFVYQILANNLVKQVYIQQGTRQNNLIEIKPGSNLNEGDVIVLEGLTKVREGSVIELIN